MSITGLRRNRDALRAVFGMGFVALIILMQFYLNRGMASGSPEQLGAVLLQQEDALLLMLGRRFPPSIWLTRMLAGTSAAKAFSGLIYSLGAAAASLGLLAWLGNSLFVRTLAGGFEVTRQHEELSGSDLLAALRPDHPFISLVKREWRLLVRHPIFLMNGLLNTFIGPVILVVMAIANNALGSIGQLLSMLPDPNLVVSLGLGAFVTFIAGTNLVASTAVSREGRSFWISQTIAVSPRIQVAAKLAHSLLYSVAGAVIPAVLVYVLVPNGALAAVTGTVLGLLGAATVTTGGLMIDIYRPQLEWDDAQGAMKGNTNGLFGMILAVALLAVFGLLTYFLSPVLSFELLVGTYTVLLFVLFIGANNAMMNMAEQSFRRVGQ
jgi:ABC-2 type transport system permease protein